MTDETTTQTTGTVTESTSAPSGPVIEVLGDATPEQLAALTAVLAAAGGAPEDSPPPRRSAWSDPSRLVRGAVHAAPGGWRASALPH
jgi:hypothetical protein